jgi:hypothetical protein
MTESNDMDPIADALGVESGKKEIEKKVETPIVREESTTADDRQNDYKMVRNNLKDIIATSTAAIDGILNVASEGESPRAYEVVSQLIKTTLEANESLVDLHKKVKDIEHTEEKQQKVTNNNMFVGSTKELLSMIKDSNKKPVELIEGEVIDDRSEES